MGAVLVQLKGSTASFSGDVVDDLGTSFHMFNPIAELALAVGPDDPLYSFWCQTCGQIWIPQLINDAQLAAPNVFYPCMTPLNIANNGLCDVAQKWLYVLFWHRLTGNPEPECDQVIG